MGEGEGGGNRLKPGEHANQRYGLRRWQWQHLAYVPDHRGRASDLSTCEDLVAASGASDCSGSFHSLSESINTRPCPCSSSHQYVKCFDSQLAARSVASSRTVELWMIGIPNFASIASSVPQMAFG